eukprot:TRINITY_DN18885_c0_g1_i1.p2 TRINITY_DN18885_c0_g1~~TRINITY_DN18885_c0_g1_i1.p2  ORF type:complete len:113 (+),score=0.04 TRINITY_DN18885_c0_g1_i1:316-654(+)
MQWWSINREAGGAERETTKHPTEVEFGTSHCRLCTLVARGSDKLVRIVTSRVLRSFFDLIICPPLCSWLGRSIGSCQSSDWQTIGVFQSWYGDFVEGTNGLFSAIRRDVGSQ